jgi:cytochrome c-type biogenesis protein CcmH
MRTAADSLVETRTRSLSAQLRCPVCQGLSLQDSPSELSQQMRDVVRSQLAMGKSDDEVKAYFVARYGEWILMEPEARGFNLLVYVLPFVGLLAGAGVLVLAVRRWTRTSPGVPSTAADASGAVASESESEIRA